MKDLEELARLAVDGGFRIHRSLGPGLLESVYETILAADLSRYGLIVDRQKPIDFEFEGIRFRDSLRVDLMVEGRLIIEIKSVDQLAPVHGRQLLTYLRLARQPLGLLMNLGGEVFRGGVKRIVNNHANFAPSRLCVNQKPTVETSA